MHWFMTAVADPALVSLICTTYIIAYYIISALCISAETRNDERSLLRKNTPLDIITSVFWIMMAIILILSLVELCYSRPIQIKYLLLYYIFFIFIFAFCYGLLEWHFEGMLSDVDSCSWEGELKYIVISIQTQTTLGYTSSKPSHPITETVACFQALLGLFFCVIFIARAVNIINL